MFNKVLIANRGAIAVRIIRTLKKMGIKSIAVYSEADRDSLHVSQADEAWCLGDGRASETYLNQDKIFEIIKSSGAEAVHPGYGFLSENPDFVKRCEAEGIAFVGPTTDQNILHDNWRKIMACHCYPVAVYWKHCRMLCWRQKMLAIQ